MLFSRENSVHIYKPGIAKTLKMTGKHDLPQIPS